LKVEQLHLGFFYYRQGPRLRLDSAGRGRALFHQLCFAWSCLGFLWRRETRHFETAADLVESVLTRSPSLEACFEIRRVYGVTEGS
jgi:hypothetical protein